VWRVNLHDVIHGSLFCGVVEPVWFASFIRDNFCRVIEFAGMNTWGWILVVMCFFFLPSLDLDLCRYAMSAPQKDGDEHSRA